MRFIVTKHPDIDGVALSRPGHWGGIRYPSPSTATDAARAHAGRTPFTIESETVRTARVQLKDI